MLGLVKIIFQLWPHLSSPEGEEMTVPFYGSLAIHAAPLQAKKNGRQKLGGSLITSSESGAFDDRQKKKAVVGEIAGEPLNAVGA